MGNSMCKRKGGLVKGSIVAILITLISILLFAVILKFFELSDSVIMPVNQVIKVLSILFGVKTMLKNCKEKGFVKGALLGIVYTLVSYLIFSLLSRSFLFDLSVILDIIFGCIIGAICGATMVNLRK